MRPLLLVPARRPSGSIARPSCRERMSHHNHGKIRLVGSSERVDGNLTPPDPVGTQEAQEAQEAPATDAGTVVSAMSFNMTELNCLAPSDPSFTRLTEASRRNPEELFSRLRLFRLLLITSSRPDAFNSGQWPVFSKLPRHPSVPREHAAPRGEVARKKEKEKNDRAWKEKDQGRPSPTSCQAPTLPPSNRGTSSCGPARAFLRSRWMPVQEQGSACQVPAGARQYHHDHSGQKTWPRYKRPVRGTSRLRHHGAGGERPGDHCRVRGLHSTSSHTRRGIALQQVQVRMDNPLCHCGLAFSSPSLPSRSRVLSFLN